MGFCARPCKSLRIKRTLPTGYACGKLLPGGVHCIERRQHRLFSPLKVVCRLRADPEHKTGSNDGAHLALQASLVAISLSIPFAAPSKAWAGKETVREEPVATVVEEEPATLRQARVLAKQADDQLFAILQAAKDSLQAAKESSTTVTEYVRVRGGEALSRAQVLKQQLVVEYGNPAALEKTEVQAAGAVVALVVLVVLFKAIASVFSSPPEVAPASIKEESASSDIPSSPPASPNLVAASTATVVGAIDPVVAAADPVVAAPSAARVEPSDAQSAAAVAAQMRDLFRDDPAQFAVMAEWLRSPAATKIRPQLVQEMSRMAALATSSQGEDNLPPAPPAVSASSSTASSSNSSTSTSDTSTPSNDAVSTKRRSIRSVDTRQLLTMVEWLRSPGAAPVRDKLGQDVADQVAMWASARVGLKLEPLPTSAPVADGLNSAQLNGEVALTSSATTEATEVSTEPITPESPATEPVTAETSTEAPSASPEPIATEAAAEEPVASSESIPAELTDTPVPEPLADTPATAAIPDSMTGTVPEETVPEGTVPEETVPEETVTATGLNTIATAIEGSPVEGMSAEGTAVDGTADAGTSASAESSSIEAVTGTVPSSYSIVTDAPVAEALSSESVLVLEPAEPKVVVSQAAVVEPIAEAVAESVAKAKAPEEPAKPKTLVDVLNKGGPATPALLALGFGALALDAMVGMSKSMIKNTSLKSTKNSSSKSTKATPRNGVAPSAQNSSAKTESTTPMPLLPPIELESVTFSFDEEETRKVVSKSK